MRQNRGYTTAGQHNRIVATTFRDGPRIPHRLVDSGSIVVRTRKGAAMSIEIHVGRVVGLAASLGVGASASFVVQVNSSSTALPTAFTLNGTTCTAG